MREIRLRARALIVFEGLDSAGKSTQLNELQRRVEPDSASFAHMPSGFSVFTESVRALLDDPSVRPDSGLAQQLAHLACHAESQTTLRERLAGGAVVLDRWWWSALAYGWGGGAVGESGVPRAVFEGLVEAIWGGLTADVVFLFASPHEEDANNNSAVATAYDALAERFAALTIRVPQRGVGEVTDWIIEELDRRQLLVSA